MKVNFVFLFALVAVASAGTRIRREEKYLTKFDSIDVDAILKNERLLNNYFKCLMGQGVCTPEGAELKKVLPDALETQCKKCSEEQKKGATKVIKFLVEERPNLFAQLEKKYDPNGVYLKKYKEEANRRNIKL